MYSTVALPYPYTYRVPISGNTYYITPWVTYKVINPNPIHTSSQTGTVLCIESK